MEVMSETRNERLQLDDSIPRPPPKPSNIEQTVAQYRTHPEVPDVSLIFDRTSAIAHHPTREEANEHRIITNQRSRISRDSKTPPYRSEKIDDRYDYGEFHSKKVTFPDHGIDRISDHSLPARSCPVDDSTASYRSHSQPHGYSHVDYNMAHDCRSCFRPPTTNNDCNCGCIRTKQISSNQQSPQHHYQKSEPPNRQPAVADIQGLISKFEVILTKYDSILEQITENFISKGQLKAITDAYEIRLDEMRKRITKLENAAQSSHQCGENRQVDFIPKEIPPNVCKDCKPAATAVHENTQPKQLTENIDCAPSERFPVVSKNIPSSISEACYENNSRKTTTNETGVNKRCCDIFTHSSRQDDRQVHKEQSSEIPNEAVLKMVNQSRNITSPDLSFCMNALAMKYLSEKQSSANDFGGHSMSPTKQVSINYCNSNVSIATLQYLQRYRLLSVPDKPSVHDDCESKRATNQYPRDDAR